MLCLNQNQSRLSNIWLSSVNRKCRHQTARVVIFNPDIFSIDVHKNLQRRAARHELSDKKPDLIRSFFTTRWDLVITFCVIEWVNFQNLPLICACEPTHAVGRNVKDLFHSSQKPTRKLAARTFIQSQYLKASAMSGKEAQRICADSGQLEVIRMRN